MPDAAIVATLVPVALCLAGAVALVAVWIWAAPPETGEADDPDADQGGGGGWGVRPPEPRRPPPVGPDSWPVFEREFAAYVAAEEARRARRPAEPDRAFSARGS
jgi:hypothetical protein